MPQIEEPIPMYYRIDVQGRYYDNDVVNTFFYLETNLSPEIGNPSFYAWSRFAARFDDFYGAFGVQAMQYSTIRVRRFNGFGLDPTSSVFAFAVNGSVDEQGVPPQIACVVKRKGGNTGSRRYRGRLHLAGLPLSHCTGNTIDVGSASWTLLESLATWVRQRLSEPAPNGGSLWAMIPVIGNFRTKLLPGQQYSVRAVDSTQARAFLGTQRHRAPGHGRYG